MLNSNIKKPVRSRRSSSSADSLFLFALNHEDIDILKAYLSRESDSQRLQNMLSAKYYSIVDIAMNNNSHNLPALLFRRANHLRNKIINKALYNRALNLITRKQYPETTMNIIFENFSKLDFSLQRIVLSMQQYGAFMRAAENGRLQVLELFLKQAHTLGIQEDMLKEQNYQAFRTAADRGNWQVVELLLDKAHDLNIQQAMIKVRSYYAFKAAVANNRLTVVNLLLSKIDNLIILQEMLSTTDHYPFWSAIEEGNLDTLEVLWENAGKVGVEFQKSVLNHKDYSIFYQALESANQNSLKWLWKKAGDLGLQKDMLASNHFILNVLFEERQNQYKEILTWLKTEVDKIDGSILACLKMGNRVKRSYSCSLYVNRKDYSKQKIQNLKLQQKTLISFTRFLSSLPNAKIKVIMQDPYVKTFEGNAVITRIFSQFLLLDSSLAEQFLNNLQSSAELYKRIAQDKQISKREEKEIVSLNNLLDTFETQLASSISSLPSTLSHIKSCKTFGDLSKYIIGLQSDFAIHLVASGHVVAIYRVGNDYAYFDSNFAYVQGIETADQLMKVIKEGIESAGYEVEKEGFLIERFYVTKANNELTARQKEILTKSIQTERHLLALQDQKFGPISMSGQQIHRVTLYDIGTKLQPEGSTPVLINSDMSLNKKKLMSYLKEGKITITAREYLDKLRSNPAQEILQIPKFFPFEGSRSEVKSTEKVRELVSSDYGSKLKNYELDKLLKSPIEQSINDLHLEVAKTTHLPNRLTNAAGRISLFHGGYSIIHSLRHGDYESFALGTGEMGFSLFSQLIEDRIVKATPQMIKQMKHSIYLSRGFAGVVTSPFDIYDLIRSSIDASNSVKGSKEWRDNIASAVFAGSSLVSSIALTAMAKPGIGTIVGLGIIAGQRIYSGISMVAKYDTNYQLTTSQKSRIFLHTLTLQEVPQDVQDDVIKQDIMNDYAKRAWQYLQNNTQIIAYVMGLGNVTFQDTIYHETVKPFPGLLVPKMASNIYRGDSIKIIKSYRKHVLLPSEYSYINVSTIDQYDFSSSNFGVYHRKQAREILPPITIKKSFAPITSHTAHHVMHRQLFHPKPPTIRAKIFCFTASSEGYCASAAVLDYQRINKAREIVVDLSLIEQGVVIGSNKWQNHFNIYAGRPYIFGGDGTTNVFTVNNVTFSGGIVGGDNSLNILVSNSDAKYLVYNNENGTVSFCNEASCPNPYWFIAKKISHFIGRKVLSDSVNCAEDRKIYIDTQGGNENNYDIIHNCKEVVVSPYTEITSENSDGGDTLYIKPDSGHVRINALPSKKQRFLIFPTTDLLNESNMHYSSHTNTFSIYVPMHDFTIEVKYYLSSQDNSASYTYNFILVDEHGSVIEPLIEQKTGKIDLYYLRTETKLTKVNEILEWYRSVVRLEQVCGTVASGNTSIIIGSDKSDIIPVVEGTGYVEGGKGSDLYNILPGAPISLRINNYSDDQAYDVIYIPAVCSMIMVYTGLHDLYLHVKDLVNYIQIENYLFDKHYQHLMIVDKNKDAFIPLQLGTEVKLVPFYHATENQYIFSFSANKMNSEIVIDAMLEEITVYRDGDDLLLTSSKPLIIKLKKFYSESWNNLTLHFIKEGRLNFEELLELAKLAVNYQEEVKNTYFDNVQEYHAPSSNVSHNSTKHIGVIVFEHSPNIKVSVSNKDLVFTDGSNTINVKNWNDAKHRISVLRIDNKPKAIEVIGLDKFGLSEVSKIQFLINKAILNNIIDKRINTLDTEVVNGIRYLLSVRGIESGVNTDKVLGFGSEGEEWQFISAYHFNYNSEKLSQILNHGQGVEALVWLVVKGYSNLLLENHDIDRKTLLNNLEKCFSPTINKRTINRIIKKLEVENTETVVPNIQSFIERHKEALENRIVNSFRSNASEITEDIKEHRRKRRDGGKEKGYENKGFFYGQNNAIPVMECEEQKMANSAAGMPSMLSSLFNRAKSSIGGLFNSEAVLPIGSSNSTARISQVNAQVDINGTIMLLDLLAKKVTGKKFISSESQPVPESEEQSYALNITRKFDKAVSNIVNKPAAGLIDLPEMQSKIFKAVMSGSGSKVRDILLAYATPIIGPGKAEGLFTTLQIPTKASSKPEKRSLPLYEARPQSCLNNIAIFSLGMPGKFMDRR